MLRRDSIELDSIPIAEGTKYVRTHCYYIIGNLFSESFRGLVNPQKDNWNKTLLDNPISNWNQWCQISGYFVLSTCLQNQSKGRCRL